MKYLARLIVLPLIILSLPAAFWCALMEKLTFKYQWFCDAGEWWTKFLPDSKES